MKVIPFPQIIVDKLMQYRKSNVDYTTDIRQYMVNAKPESRFQIPKNVVLRDYQKGTDATWFAQNNQGVFSMCTGAGKTYTALAAMVQLAAKQEDRLAVFIVCPYIDLVSQWEEDVLEWGDHLHYCALKINNTSLGRTIAASMQKIS